MELRKIKRFLGIKTYLDKEGVKGFAKNLTSRNIIDVYLIDRNSIGNLWLCLSDRDIYIIGDTGFYISSSIAKHINYDMFYDVKIVDNRELFNNKYTPILLRGDNFKFMIPINSEYQTDALGILEKIKKNKNR